VKSGTQEQEFINNFINGQTDAAIASVLYDVVLGRVGDTDGLTDWTAKIALIRTPVLDVDGNPVLDGKGNPINGIIRTEWGKMVDGFLGSDEYRDNFGQYNAVPGAGRKGCGVPTQDAINLGTAANFAILAKTGIATVPTSTITGNIGVSPIKASAMTGFTLTMDSELEHSTSTQVTAGAAYASDYGGTTPATLSTAVSDMEVAYTDAAGRAKGVGPRLNMLKGSLSGVTMTPGVYTFGTEVTITTDITFLGGANEVFIIQISKNLIQEANIVVHLSGGALAKNIFWQVAGHVKVGAGAKMKGILLVMTDVTFMTGSELEGRVFSQTACNLQQATITPT
jgi:hypothetical protein